MSLQLASRIALVVVAGVTLSLIAFSDDKPKTEDREKNAEKTRAVGGDLEADKATSGAITGLVLVEGKLPEAKPFEVKKDHKDLPVCGATIPYETHIVGPKKELANVVVSLQSKSLPKAKPREIELTNRHCRFVPHVQAATVGSKLLIDSEDPVLHSALAIGSESFNVAIPNTQTKVTKRVRREGWTIFKCSTHPWMTAHLQVFRHDFFAVTGRDGRFALRGIPPGEYTVEFWHEGLEGQKKKIAVEAGKTTDVTVKLEPYK